MGGPESSLIDALLTPAERQARFEDADDATITATGEGLQRLLRGLRQIHGETVAFHLLVQTAPFVEAMREILP